MYRNFLVILALAIGLVFLLVYRPWEAEETPAPRLIDRLPEAEVIGVSNVLELSNSLSSSLYYYKIPFRDLLSSEFILSQGKNYGIDVQSSVYVFMNENSGELEDWGVLASLKDSSKVTQGIVQVKKFIDLDTHKANSTTYYKSETYNMHAVYGEDWILIYHGNHFSEVLSNVLSAKFGSVKPRWSAFLDKKEEDSKIPLVTNLKLDWMEDYDINSADIVLQNDSSNFILETQLNLKNVVGFNLKESGPGFAPQEFTRHLVSLHIAPEEIRSNGDHFLRNILKRHTNTVAFPTESFWKAWEGDLAFRQGGYEYITERYIESELDENFNVTEVTKYRRVKVSGFSLYLSMNEHVKEFVTALKAKGILTQFDQKYRLLYSPPLNMSTSDTSVVLYTNRYTPNLYNDSTSSVSWGFEFSPLEFQLESAKSNILTGRIIVPLNKLSTRILPSE